MSFLSARRSKGVFRKMGRLVWTLVVLVFCMPASGYSEEKTDKGGGSAPVVQRPVGIEEQWGIRPKAIRLTGEQFFLDFRYKILDPDKAAAVTKRGEKAFLIDQDTGKSLPVTVNKLGPMRSTTVKPTAGKDYVILFTNPGRMVKKGAKVTLVIGELRIENLIVE